MVDVPPALGTDYHGVEKLPTDEEREIPGIQARTTRSYARSSRMSKEGNLDVSDRGEGNNETAVH